MPEEIASGEPTHPGHSRRTLLKGAAVGAGVLWVTPVVESFISPAAAVSGTGTVGLFKSGNGSSNPALTTLCQNGPGSPAGRGTAVFTRTEGGTPQICVTVTLSTGADASSRSIYILQSNAGGTCLGGSVTAVGTWSASAPSGPQTFCAPIVSGATRFVVAQQLTGGGGNDGWSSAPVSLP
jgi:hypothetical protein